MAIPTRTVALYDRILEAVPGGIVYVAHDGTLLLANEAAQRFLGLRLVDESQRYVSDFDGETYRDDGSICPVNEYPVSLCLSTGLAQPPRVIGVRQPSGEVRWAVFTALPFDPRDGNPNGAVVTFVDITERKRAEEHVRVLQAELAQRDRLATVGTLAASVAHEINNPLSFIFLGIEAAQDALEHDPSVAETRGIREPLEQASEGARRVRNIVADLTAFARVRDESLQPIDVTAAMESSIRMAMPQMRYSATLERDFADDLPPVLAMEGRLSQVFLNLLLNSMRSFEPGGSNNRIVVTARQDRGDVVIEVADNGPGIAPDIAERVFDPFFTTRADGTGLGLPISRSLIEQADGSLTLDRSHNPGSLFRVRLPGARSLQTTTTTSTTPATPALAAPATRLRVLFIDDEPLIGQLAVAAFAPHDAVVVQSVADALGTLQQESFDAIVCDTMMPDGSGIEVYRWLEVNRPASLDTFLFITGGTFTDEVMDFFGCHDTPVLRKPFSRSDLRARFVKLIEG